MLRIRRARTAALLVSLAICAAYLKFGAQGVLQDPQPIEASPAPQPCVWDVVDVPDPSPITWNELVDVDGTGQNDVWAVGESNLGDDGSGFRTSTLIEHWNGVNWSVVPSPNPGQENRLNAIDAISPSDAWAVGHTDGPDGRKPLSLHWNGDSWTVVPMPSLDTTWGLMAISASSATDVWAVGSIDNATDNETATFHWDGLAWTLVPTPSSAPHGTLWAVTSVSTGDAWAAGTADYESFMLHWDGTAWARTTQPGEPLKAELHSMADLSADDVWAIGYRATGEPSSLPPIEKVETFIERWDGSGWSVVQSPNVNVDWNLLRGTAMASPMVGWAVGGTAHLSGVNYTHPLVLRWDGAQWTIDLAAEVPGAGDGSHILESVFAVSANEAWAVGRYYTDGQHNLVEHCVPDSDGDGIPNPSDNCPVNSNPGQGNQDGDEYGDACEQPNCVNIVNHWSVGSDDTDCDGYADTTQFAPRASESTIGTVAAAKCSATASFNDEPLPDAWPPDFNDNQLVNGSDILSFNVAFGKTTANPPVTLLGTSTPVSRFDLNGNGLVNGADLLQLNAFMFKRCSS